jgi:DNA topoisomerase VI subunit B
VDVFHQKMDFCLIGCGLSHKICKVKRRVRVFLNIITPYIPFTSDGKSPDLVPISPQVINAIDIAIIRAKRNTLKTSKSKSQKEVIRDHYIDAIELVFTTHLDRAGMKRNHIQVLRGDVGNEAIDIYIHNDMEKIRKEYLACVPRLSA